MAIKRPHPHLPPCQLPIGFVANNGQITDQCGAPNQQVKFLLNLGTDLKVQLHEDGLSYEILQSTNKGTTISDRIDIRFLSTSINQKIFPEHEVFRHTYHLINQMITATTYQKITYKEVWPHIDIEFLVKPNNEKPFEYNFIIKPGGKVQDIQLAYQAESNGTIQDGDLVFQFPNSQFIENIPASFYYPDRTPVHMTYQACPISPHQTIVSFDGIYHTNRTLVIDPAPRLEWGTYYGGPQEDTFTAIAQDDDGAIYAAGGSNSLSNIATTGAHQNELVNRSDVMIVKMNPSGQRLWATYFGNIGTESAHDLVLDAQNNIYIVGPTASPGGMGINARHQPNFGGGSQDAFLAKFTSGGQLIWSTYFGGTGTEHGNGITLDQADNIYICGSTDSPDGIATAGVHQLNPRGTFDAFISKFSNDGQFQWATYYGGDQLEECYAIKSTPNNEIIIGGSTSSRSNIATNGSFQSSYGGGFQDGFLAAFSTTGRRIWGTYIGGEGEDEVLTMAIDESGQIYASGNTYSENAIATSGTHQSSYRDASDVFLKKFSPTGDQLWGTYFGGNGADQCRRIALDEDGGVYMVGSTQSANGIATDNAHQPQLNSANQLDGFVSKFNAEGEQEWGTYYGGTGYEIPFGILITPEMDVIIAGGTGSDDRIAFGDTHQSTFAEGDADGFIARFTVCEGPELDVPNGGYLCQNNRFSFELNFTGNPPFTIVYEIDGQTTDSVTTSQNPFFLPFEEGSYQDSIVITKVRDDLCDGTITGMPFLKVVERLSASPAETTCNGEGTYTVSFDLSGGWGDYLPDPVSDGLINGERFTSRPVPLGEDFAFLITISLGCDAINVSGRSPNCPLNCPDLNLEIVGSEHACAGETIELEAPGFQTYRWSGPRIATTRTAVLTIQDAEVTDRGIYELMVTNDEGCSDTAAINVVINEVPMINDGQLQWCSNDSIAMEVSGGLPPIQIALNDQDFLMTNQLANPGPGNYTFLAKDQNGCTDSVALEVFSVPNILNVDTNPAICNEPAGEIIIEAVGNSPLSYQANGVSFGTQPTLRDLPPGDYQVLVEDRNGCATAMNIALEEQPSPEIEGFNSFGNTCGESNGSLFIQVFGGTSPILHSIDGGNTFSEEAFFDNLLAGRYPVIVKDDSGCADSLTIEIDRGSQPPVIDTVMIFSTDCNNPLVDVQVEISGGSGNTFFSLSNRPTQTAAIFTALAPGSYQVLVSDDAGCLDSLGFTVSPSQLIGIEDLIVQDASCTGKGGRIAFTLSGSEQIQLRMNDSLVNAQNPVFENLSPGSYQFLAQDERDCRAELMANIGIENCNFNAPNIFSPNDDGVNDFFQILLPDLQNGLVVSYRIYDRWGNQVYEALNFPLNTVNHWWNGKVNNQRAPIGVYVFDIMIQLENGLEIPLRGDVTLVH